ncbi:MAG: hypothetical protein NVSMB60_31230 [Mycobacterium sp.]
MNRAGFAEGLWAYLAAEGVDDFLPVGAGRDVVGVKDLTADRVGFAVCAARIVTAHLRQPDRVG